MALGKGIPVINGFDLNSKLPLDSRSVADTKENMQKLVTDASVGDGQLCYCKEDKKLYVLKESAWSEVGGEGGVGKSVPPTLNLVDFDNGGVRTTITEEEYNNLANGLYNQVLYTTESDIIFALAPSKLFSMAGSHYFTQFKISMNADETISYSSMVAGSIIIDAKNTSNEYPITVFEEAIIDTTGTQIVDCTLTDQTDITKGGTVDNVPNAPFLLRIPLNLQDEGSYGKHLLDNILVPMNYTYGKFEQGIQKAVPDRYSGVGFALSTCVYVEVDISTKKVIITSQVNASYIMLPVNLPTKSQPTITISNPKQDITLQPMLVGNDFYSNGVVLYGYLFSWASPVYSKDNTMFYYTASHNDVNNNLTIRYHEIPTPTIPSLPADASTKNYALNSVNGTLTWNTIGNGLKINEAESKLELDYRFVTLKFHNLTYTFNDSVSAFNTLCIDITTYSYVLDSVLNNASSILGIEVNRNNISSLFTQFDNSTFLQFIRGLIAAIVTLELTAYSNFHIYESASEQQNIINNYNALLIENLDGFFFPVYTGPGTIKNLWISGNLNKNENSTFTFRESWYGD